jgi:hypothetical protein
LGTFALKGNFFDTDLLKQTTTENTISATTLEGKIFLPSILENYTVHFNL